MAERKDSSSSAEDNADPESSDEESRAVVNSIVPQDHSPSEKNSECTLHDSDIRGKGNEKISESSPTITGFTRKTDGVCLIKLDDNKTYYLPFVLNTNTTQPEVKIVQGIQCIEHESVWYKVTRTPSGSPCLKNGKSGKDITLREVCSTGDRREESIEGKSGSLNEFRQTSESHIGEFSVMKGPYNKAKTGAGISPSVNTVQKSEREMELRPGSTQTQVGDSEQTFNNKLSKEEIEQISLEQKEKMCGKPVDQTCMGLLNESQERCREHRPLEGIEKIPEREISVNDSYQKDERKIDSQVGVNNIGDSAGESDNLSGEAIRLDKTLSHEAANQTDENMADQLTGEKSREPGGKKNEVTVMSEEESKVESSEAHLNQTQESHASSMSTNVMASSPGVGKSPIVLKVGSYFETTLKLFQEQRLQSDLKGNSSQTIKETKNETSQQDANNIPGCNGKILEACMQQIDKDDHAKAVERSSDENSGICDDGDSGSKVIVALETQSVQASASTSERVTGLEEHDCCESIGSPATPEIISEARKRDYKDEADEDNADPESSDEESRAVGNSIVPQDQSPSEKNSECTLHDSGIRGKGDEKIPESSPTITGFTRKTDGACLIKLDGNKTYYLPFVLNTNTTQPEVKIVQGIQCIEHESVWYKVTRTPSGSPCLKNGKSGKDINLSEVCSIGDRREESIEGKSGSLNEFRQTSESHIGEFSVMKGPCNKSKTCAGISPSVNTVQKSEREMELRPGSAQSQVGDSEQTFKNKISKEEIEQISLEQKEKMCGKPVDQTCMGLLNESQERCREHRPLEGIEKIPEREVSMNDSDQKDERKIDSQVGVNNIGDSAGESDNLSGEVIRLDKTLSHEAANQTDENMADQLTGEKIYQEPDRKKNEVTVMSEEESKDESSGAHLNQTHESHASSMSTNVMASTPGVGKSPIVLKVGSYFEMTLKLCQEQRIQSDSKGNSSQTIKETKNETSQQDANNIPGCNGKILEACMQQIDKDDHAKAVEGSRDENSGIFDDGDSGSKVIVALETQSVQASASTSERVTGLEEHDCESIGSPAIPEIISENEASETKIHSPPPGKKPLMSAPKNNQDWQCNAGKGPQLNLYINYWRLQEEEMDDDTCFHKIHCYLGFLTCWNFYNQTVIGKKLLDAIVSKHNCHVELSTDTKLQGFFIFKISDKQFKEESDVKRFVEVVLDDVNICAQQQLCLDLVSVNREIQEDVRQRMKQTEELGQCVWIEFGGKYDPETMYTVCLQEKQTFVQQQITDLIRDAKDCFNNHEEMIPVDFIWQNVMIRFSYHQKIKDKFPQIKIVPNEEGTAFVLRGPKDVLKAAKSDLLALLETAHKELHEESFAPLCEFEIFGHQEMCDYINQAIPKVPIVWIPNHETKKIHLFARNPEQVQGMDKSIKGCVKEKNYPMSKDASMFSHETTRSLEELKKKYMGKIVIHSSKTGLYVATADSLFESVDATIDEIISRERDTDGATHVPKKDDERDKSLGNKTDPATTDGHQETKDLPSQKGMVTNKPITKTVTVKNKNVFHKLLEELKSYGEDQYVTVKEIKTETNVGFKLTGYKEQDIRNVFHDITQRIKLLEQQLQPEQGSADSVSDYAILEEEITPDPFNTGQSLDNKTSDNATEEVVTPTPPPRGKKGKSPEAENTGPHEGVDNEQAVTIQPVRWAHKSHVKVHVKTGSFENETPDCLLVFWNKRCLDKISDKSILLELAGKEVKEKWMEHRKKGGFERNVVFVTAGGKLKCQRIFHVACDITSYIIAAKDGLTRADQYKMKTVVIPLLQNETFMIDVNKYQKEMVKAIQDLTTGLKVVKSVTLVIQGKCDLPLLNEVFQKKNKVLGTRKKPEDDKRGHRSVNKEQWVAPSRSVPPETMAQNVSPDEPVHDIKTYLRPMTDIKELKHGTKPFKVEQLQPQDLDLHAPDCLVERVQNTGQKETLFANLKDLSGVEINMKDNRGATTQEMNIAKHCLESSTPYEELCGYRTSINNVSELEFKALQIIKNGFRKEEGVHISWDGHSVVICGSPTLALCVKKCLTGIVMALRCKQSEEIFLDEEEKKIVRAVIEEVQSEDTICVFDEQMNQVAVYSDKQDDIRKFKHKLKIQTGKVKESGRSKHRFVGNSPLLEECQEKFSFMHKSTAIQQELSLSKNESDVEIFYTKENIKISVYKANILNLPVDCIVNAANDTLQHGGGVCKVIADAAGSELVQEGDAIIKEMKNGKIPVACQVSTTADRLPYRCVIHTVGPCWADYKPHNLQKVKDCEKDLYAAIFGCFSEAEKNGLSSIALPAVSSGIYDVPQDMCAVQYAKAVLDYSRKSRQGQALKEIHFIDKCSSLVKLMQDTFRTMIQEGKVPNFNIQNYVASSSSHQIEQSKDTGRKEHGKQDLEVNATVKLKELSPFYYESDVRHTKQFVFQVFAKPVVCIYEGDILKVKNMDAVVCPDDTNGLGKGSISVDLRTKTKYKQQKEKCFEKQKPNLGDVVITYGEETTFNVIVHVVIENNSPQKPGFMSTMKKSIDNILRKTNEWVCVKTIAMPLFGVEQELLTEKSWAELFLERFVAFYCEVENPNLEEVHIVTHCSSGSAYSTLKKVFIDFADEVNKTHIQEKESPPRPIIPTDSRTSNDTKQRAELCSPAKRTQNKMQLPSHWTSMKVTDVLQVPLDSKDIEAAIIDEYSMVKRDFDKTMSGAEIVSVKRIQNALLWEHYALQKKEMEIKAGGEGLVNEMHLYHGTTPDAVDLICHSNFDFRMAGERVGAKYGQGAYFASDARYSDSYTVRDDRNHKFMFVAKVLIGKTCLGKPPYKKPPYLDDNDKKKGTYNTCVNDVSNPTVYCVFDKNQYYPEYLVEYKLKVKESSV